MWLFKRIFINKKKIRCSICSKDYEIDKKDFIKDKENYCSLNCCINSLSK